MEELDWLKTSEETAAETKAETDGGKKFISSEGFVTTWPLYSSAWVDGFHPPHRMNFLCNDKDCKRETTWSLMYEPQSLSPSSPDPSLRSVAYRCGLCNRSSLTIIYKEAEVERRIQKIKSTGVNLSRPIPPPPTYEAVTKVLKVGQYPAQPIYVPTDLAKNLGKDCTDLYKKALINRNNGYGLGSIVYTRRVVEDKTNELIEVAAQLAESHGVDAATVAKMRAAAISADYTPYEDKLKVASTVFPDSLKVGDVNPLKSLYGLVSKGIHSLSEVECIEVADQTIDVFVYMFSKLRAEIADRRAFLDKVKKLG